jgi:hypothetical protein
MQQIPAIYVRQMGTPRLGLWARLLAGAVAGVCLALLILAHRLNPSASGVGTHTGIGLQECGFLKRTGLPCASCGMTTSFAHFAHGQVAASFWVQPMGFVLALLTAATFWAAAYIAVSGRPAHRLLRMLSIRYHLLALLFLAVAAWGWKIFIHLFGHDGWS